MVAGFEALSDTMYPALLPSDAIEQDPSKPWHVLINADNYHALQLLLYGYERKVDVIYIDPPYNSGARDWKYNNDYIDRNDRYRHSKWLSMIKKRLRLAKRLLKPDGVLICTIDENEIGHLSVLFEELFPEYLRHMVCVVINPKGTGKLNFARVDEYAFFCVPNNGTSVVLGVPAEASKATAPGEGALFFPSSSTPLFPAVEDEVEPEEPEEDDEELEEELNGDDELEEVEDSLPSYPFLAEELPEWELRHARRRGSESSYRHQRKNQFYAIYINEKERKVVRAGPPLLPIEMRPNFDKVDGLTPIWPIDKEKNDRCWRFIFTEMQKLNDVIVVFNGKNWNEEGEYSIGVPYDGDRTSSELWLQGWAEYFESKAKKDAPPKLPPPEPPKKLKSLPPPPK